jgi:hypothetical protein
VEVKAAQSDFLTRRFRPIHLFEETVRHALFENRIGPARRKRRKKREREKKKKKKKITPIRPLSGDSALLGEIKKLEAEMPPRGLIPQKTKSKKNPRDTDPRQRGQGTKSLHGVRSDKDKMLR